MVHAFPGGSVISILLQVTMCEQTKSSRACICLSLKLALTASHRTAYVSLLWNFGEAGSVVGTPVAHGLVMYSQLLLVCTGERVNILLSTVIGGKSRRMCNMLVQSPCV